MSKNLFRILFLFLALLLVSQAVWARTSSRGSRNNSIFGSFYNSTTTTDADDEDEEDLLEGDYKSSSAKRAIRNCVFKYCEGDGNAFGKCFNTNTAKSYISSYCSDT